VAIGIVGILSGLLFPSLCNARAKARTSTCSNNLRQIGVALALYIGEFHAYPTHQLWGGVALPSYSDHRVLPYLGRNRRSLNCPDKRSSAQVPLSSFSYGYNGLGSGRWESTRRGLGFWAHERMLEAQVRIPADLIAIGETGVDLVSDTLLNPNADLHNRGEPPWPAAPWLPANRHRNRANMLFADAHVETDAQEHWIEKTDRTRRRWNNDHQPHPESW
jgi:prepilin-type processing-associated H-X9-DG protein